MLTFTEEQVMQWLLPMLWPFIRVLALITTLPIFSQRGIPFRVKIGLALLISLGAQTSLPSLSELAMDSSNMFMLVVQQLLIGWTLGFSVRLIFAAIELAGELIGLQMGLNFAMFFDPQSGGQMTSVSRFYSTLLSLLFITSNAHLLIIMAVIGSFESFPVGPEPFAFLVAMKPHIWGAEIFKLGLWIALPLTAMLLFTNIVLGLIARIAPQLNIFAIGFPITLLVGLIGMVLTLPLIQTPFGATLEFMLKQFQQ